MSVIISNVNTVGGKILIADEHKMIFRSISMKDGSVEIHGTTSIPFFTDCSFGACEIKAENMDAFVRCIFDGCDMRIKNMETKNSSSDSVLIVKGDNLIITTSSDQS